MALGSQNNAVRKTFKKEIAGKSDWKSAVNSPNEAYTMKTTILDNLAKDPNGKYLLAAYCQRQVDTLDDYIKNGNGKTLKEYLRGKAS
jgi:hypothetical protein